MLGESTSVGRTRWLTRTGDSRAVGSRVLSSSECLLAVARDARDLFVLLLRGRHPGPKWHRKSRKRRTYRKLRRSPERSGNGGPFRTGLPCGGGERRSSNVRSTANNLQQILENYSPWGKPGGGAPCAATLRKKNVPLEPPDPPKCQNFGQGWTSNSTIERLNRRGVNPLAVTDMNKFFDDKADPGIAADMQLVQDHRHRYNEEVQVYELTGGVELVPLLTSRRYYSQPQSTRHVATDATRPGYSIEPLRPLGMRNREYIAELVEQIRRKREIALEERRTEQESCRRHFDTWRRLWGRPGHGAPIDHAHRNNLHNILYRPAIY
ncbi:uncharacterized protein LOC128893008 isoform X2 [Hylaeus anthracinus]|uniref:uncharacterized protein LOC128893008 isoform X2 n=1 Tax=Hylaeus anthracinus TaxID=313031 RepID=UPI0023B899C0|nr:uncharacterized protein LOC128893008 isoform X2 [Hylaeus anthracinus]